MPTSPLVTMLMVVRSSVLFRLPPLLVGSGSCVSRGPRRRHAGVDGVERVVFGGDKDDVVNAGGPGGVDAAGDGHAGIDQRLGRRPVRRAGR